jgi:hypothetical protein
MEEKKRKKSFEAWDCPDFEFSFKILKKSLIFKIQALQQKSVLVCKVMSLDFE